MPATKGVPETSAGDLVRGDFRDGLPGLSGNLSHLLPSLTPAIAMAQPAQPRHRDHGPVRARPWFDGASVRRVLPQRVGQAIVRMVAHAVAHHAAEMFLMERDDVVALLPPTTADPSLRKPILPWRRHARPLGLQARCGPETGHF